MISQITENIEGSKYPQTTSTYHCTNPVCQNEKDKQAENRLKLLRDKELAESMKNEKKLQEKKLLIKLGIEENE